MLYKKNSEPQLNKDLFKNPTAEYRGTPFWAWNNYLTADELCRQIDVFKEMGLGGFHMHVRTGLKNTYLDDKYMELVKACVDKAKAEEMLAWLYDEDRWPSGAAGGYVTKDESLRSRSLIFTTVLDGNGFMSNNLSRAEASRTGNGKLLAVYDVVLDENGYLKSYKKIEKDDTAQGTKWYAILEVCCNNSWYNDQAYADTLNKKAIEKFIEVTHETYKKKVGDEFDKTVPAIFTDEPQFTRKQTFENSFDTKDVAMPWTDSVPELYKELYGTDIFETLPEIFWDLKDSAPSLHRYRYHDFISELFTMSFADTVGGWCKENGISLTGHMMEEHSLHSQTAALGEAMRSYRSFQLPGIDLLCNSHEFTTAKQAQSAAHQFGCEGVLSELYGVTGWDCDFRTYKHQGDWQAALGITIRVPHLSWYAMEGEAKRDYPASISYQSPWYKEYGLIENHFARVNTALTRGKPVIKVGVIHPVESFWLHWGPNDKSAVYRDGMDEKFLSLASWLLNGSIDFNFISESLLPSLCKKGSAPLKVGEMEYDTIIVPGCETLRSSTLERLEEFKKQGGRLLFLGEAPKYCDAAVSERGKALFDASESCDFTRSAVNSALENEKIVNIRNANGKMTANKIYQLRKDTDCLWLFVCSSSEPYNKHLDYGQDLKITVKGEYGVIIYNTETGETYPADFTHRNKNTIISQKYFGYDSCLYKLVEKGTVEPVKAENIGHADKPCTYSLVDYELSEYNVLLLDMQEHKLEGEPDFSPKEEILRIDNICREKLGIRLRGGADVQPWVYGEKEPISKVTLRYTFNSEIDYEGAQLALERVDTAEVTFNGEKCDTAVIGKFVDISIDKINLPKIKKGENELIITFLFGESANLENVFILGKFGVKLQGFVTTVTALPEKIGFGTIQEQGFPFYGGNITYKMPVEIKNNKITVCTSDYIGALLSASVDGVEIGKIAYPPCIANAVNIENGQLYLEVTLFGNRYNTFGPVHLVNEKESWHGPDAWRSKNNNWSYEYVLRKTGLLKAPVIE